MKKYIYILLASIGMIACQKEKRLTTGSQLEGREFVVYSISGQYHYINVNQGYGKSIMTMSFKKSTRGLHFRPDTAVKMWVHNNQTFDWVLKRALGDTQSVSFLSNYRSFLELEFPLPNEDIIVEKYNRDSYIPTSILSGDYQVVYGYLPGTGQKGYTLTKYDRFTNQPFYYGAQQNGVPLVTIQLLDR